MNGPIIKGVVKGLAKLGGETVEKMADESQKILESTITGKELLGLDGTMTEKEVVEAGKRDEVSKVKEVNKIKSEIPGSAETQNQKQKEKGRDVEGEIKEVREKRKSKEEEEERIFLENIKKQREEEKAEEKMAMGEMAVSTNPAKQKKSRGSAFSKKKKSGVDDAQLSQTSEFKGKID